MTTTILVILLILLLHRIKKKGKYLIKKVVRRILFSVSLYTESHDSVDEIPKCSV